MKCPKCQNDLTVDALFCPKCGNETPHQEESQSTGNQPTLGREPLSVGDAQTVRSRVWKTGQKVMGRYQILGELGRGGMGVVYKCLDEVGGIEVALKALPPELSHNSSEMEEVRENFQLVCKLAHPHIATVRTLERDPQSGDYFLILELVEGIDVRKWRKQAGGKVSLEKALPALHQMAQALDYAHSQKIIHRDIKPGNVMVRPDGTVKVLDFGLAAQIQSSLSRVSQVHFSTSGTGPYMAPEQWKGQRQDGATDQYALASITYELLSGRVPFDVQDQTALRESVIREAVQRSEDITDGTWAVVLRALSKEPTDRYPNCVAFVEALEGKTAVAATLGSAIKIAPSDTGEKVSGARQRRRYGVKIAVAVGLLFICALMSGWYWGMEKPRQMAEQARAEVARKEAEHLANARGSLVVKTKPAGALVVLAGDQIEKSPATFKSVKIGKQVVVISLDDYEPLKREVEVKENDLLDLGTIELTRSCGTLDIKTTQTGVSYTLTSAKGEIGPRHGSAPAQITGLPTADYTLTLTRPGWSDQSQKVTIRANQASPVSYEFEEGSVSLQSIPVGLDCELAELGGKQQIHTGKTPLEFKSLPTGGYKARMQRAGWSDYLTNVVVAKGEVLTVQHEFEEGELAVSVDPAEAEISFDGESFVKSGVFSKPEGTYHVKARYRDWTPISKEVQVQKGQKNKALLKFSYGTVKIES